MEHRYKPCMYVLYRRKGIHILDVVFISLNCCRLDLPPIPDQPDHQPTVLTGLVWSTLQSFTSMLMTQMLWFTCPR